jgi:hypothetical protein
MTHHDESAQRETKSFLARHGTWWLVVVVLLLSASVRWRLLDVPLERDEGEYAYVGQLILQGTPPYTRAYNMKLPGTYASYAVILAIFGETERGIHLGLLVINLTTVVLVYLLGRRMMDETVGVISAAAFALLSISQPLQGAFANCEHFVNLMAIAGLLPLINVTDNRRSWPLIASGLLLGSAFVMKQHGIAFVAFGGFYLLIDEWRRKPVQWPRLGRKCATFVLAAVTPYLLTCLTLWLYGAFDEFWFWTVTCASTYSSNLPTKQVLLNLLYAVRHVTRGTELIWLLVALGATALVWSSVVRRQRLFLGLLSLFSFLAVCPGFYFRPHYFQLTLPAAALLVGVAIRALSNPFSKYGRDPVAQRAAIGLCLTCFGASVFQQRHYLFEMTPMEIIRLTYPSSPFVEARTVAEYIQSRSDLQDRIAVICNEPEIYFYAQRRAATGHLYLYPLRGDRDFAPRLRQEMIDEIENARAKFVIIFDSSARQKAPADSLEWLFDWLEQYVDENYHLVGVVDMSDDGTSFHWAPDARGPPEAGRWIRILERNK